MGDKKQSVALGSVLTSTVLAVTKLLVGIITGSMGILSEGLHSFLDLGAAGLTFFAVRVGDRPPDQTHPWGHGKIESVSALVETGLLFVTSFGIIYEAARRLIAGDIHPAVTWYAFAVIVFSILVDASRSRALKKVAAAAKSPALEADALHFSSDVWSSAVVLLGLVFVRFGIAGADAVAAIGVSVFILIAGYRLGRRTLDVLVDTAPAGMAETVRRATAKVSGVLGINQVRVRSLGSNILVEIGIDLDRRLSVLAAGDIKKNVEKEIRKRLPGADVTICSRSVQLTSETIVETVQALAAGKNVAVHDIVVDEFGGRKFVSYDLEVPDSLRLQEAHALATGLEQAIKDELGPEVEPNSHLEPLKNGAVASSAASDDEIQTVEEAIRKTDREVAEIRDIHNILIRKIKNRLIVSFHCLSAPDLPLGIIHDATSRFERILKSRAGKIEKVVIHVEPKPE